MPKAKKKVTKKVVEKATGEMYMSKAAMKKHEGMETKAMQKMEKMMPKKTVKKAVKGKSFASMMKKKKK